jgi:hypothetical protein
MGLTILEVFLGAIISIVTTITVEYLRKPRLKIQIAEHTDVTYDNRPAGEVRFLHLKLVNESLSPLLRWMLRETALQCHGTISFHHLDGQNVFGRSMPIRWSGSPEPVTLNFVVAVDDKRFTIIDPTRLTLISRMDVQPGESETFDVAAKFDNEEECYGWSNESYFSEPIWRNPDWRIPRGRYLIKATIVSAGQKVTEIFRLINDVDQQDFRLEPAQETDEVRD